MAWELNVRETKNIEFVTRGPCDTCLLYTSMMLVLGIDIMRVEKKISRASAFFNQDSVPFNSPALMSSALLVSVENRSEYFMPYFKSNSTWT